MHHHPEVPADGWTRRDRPEREEHPPIWRNTRPRGNPERDWDDFERGVARIEAVLGR
jgi:hypothetical protein